MRTVAWRENMFQYLSAANLSVPRGQQFDSWSWAPAKNKFPSIFFKANGGYCIYYPSNVFRDTQDLKIGIHRTRISQDVI